jgi:fructose PTS system EIIBC or EIIC component
MAKIVASAACSTGNAHTFMAAEALKKTSALMGQEIAVEILTSSTAGVQLSKAEIEAADVVILASDLPIPEARFAGKPVLRISPGCAIRETRRVIAEAMGLCGAAPAAAPAAVPPPPQKKRIVAITACPTGIAHTFMAAEALKKAAAARGIEIKVETQGSVGSKNQLSEEDIRNADAVIIGADTHVDTSRFAGKAVYETSVGKALKGAGHVIDAALSAKPEAKADYMQEIRKVKTGRSEKRQGPYKHLLTGVSYMLPIVVAGGLSIALSFIFGIEAFKTENTLAAALMKIGGSAAFGLMVPVLSGFIALSIADRPGLAPGLIGGMLATQLQTGFLGGMIAGFLAGYIVLAIRRFVKLPAGFEGLQPVLVIPLISTLAVGLLMVYVVGAPAKFLMDGLTQFLKNAGSANAALLGLLLGGMMAVDMGGPVNKAAYAFAVGLLASQAYMPMAAVMAAGMTPPLGVALATLLARRRFSDEEREAGKAAVVLGISFITEGVIPFAAKDPLRVLPACIAGSAVTGALSMFFGCTLRAPHGGIFVLAIPNAVGNLLFYVAAIAAGTVITALILSQLKRPIMQKDE